MAIDRAATLAKDIRAFYDGTTKNVDKFRKRNGYYHRSIVGLLRFLIPVSGKEVPRLTARMISCRWAQVRTMSCKTCWES